MKWSCLLFCDCGAINTDGTWQPLDLSLQAFLAGYIFRSVQILEWHRVTCPNCLYLAPKKELYFQ
jgi:hypothetical protein